MFYLEVRWVGRNHHNYRRCTWHRPSTITVCTSSSTNSMGPAIITSISHNTRITHAKADPASTNSCLHIIIIINNINNNSNSLWTWIVTSSKPTPTLTNTTNNPPSISTATGSSCNRLKAPGPHSCTPRVLAPHIYTHPPLVYTCKV